MNAQRLIVGLKLEQVAEIQQFNLQQLSLVYEEFLGFGGEKNSQEGRDARALSLIGRFLMDPALWELSPRLNYLALAVPSHLNHYYSTCAGVPYDRTELDAQVAEVLDLLEDLDEKVHGPIKG